MQDETNYSYSWGFSTTMHLCPARITEDAIYDYKDNLILGKHFSSTKYGKSYVVDSITNVDELKILTYFDTGGPEWSVLSVTIKDGKFHHQNLGLKTILPAATELIWYPGKLKGD